MSCTIRVFCNVCPKECKSMRGFKTHWRRKHLPEYGWGCAYPKIVRSEPWIRQKGLEVDLIFQQRRKITEEETMKHET